MIYISTSKLHDHTHIRSLSI